MTDRPPYRVPSMAEIAALPWNGLTVATTFAGAGGSSLGYRLAGFKVVWASEFVEAARAVYEANKASGTIVDGRDVREVDPAALLKTLGLRAGELDVLDGSPPCSDFSTAGKRSKGWGKVKKYSETEQRVDDLFFEFVRVLRGLRPKTFVAENVSGLVKGVAKGYFVEILQAMKASGYRVEARLLDAQWLGVPQQRQRIIFVGVREDLKLDPVHPTPLPYRHSVRDAIGAVGRIVGGNYANFSQRGAVISKDAPAPAITAGVHGGGPHQFYVEPEADISEQAIGREYDRLNPGEASDRYFNLVRSDQSRPAPTITASGGMNSGIACAVHPSEKRKFSIAELKRLCSFPDDFALSGTYAQQWERLGRAVPPMMMKAIAEAIRDRVLLPLRERTRTPARARRSADRSTNGSRPRGEERRRSSRRDEARTQTPAE